MNGKRALLVPWLGDVSAYEHETFDLMFGHFDVSQKYLMKSYIEDNMLKTSATEEMSAIIDSDSMLKTAVAKSSAGDYVGDFIDVVKRDGTVFSGHIHGHKEFIAKGRKFIFVGDPY